MEDSHLDAVEAEVVILKSAYNEQFFDLRKNDPWKVSRPPEVQIILGPNHSEGGRLHSHVNVVLKIKTSEKYPHKPPKVILESHSGISDKEADDLILRLERKAHEFAQKGEVVMLNLCCDTQDFLSEHARPYTDSIYDEMVAEQESRRKADEEARKEVQRQQEIQEENNRIIMKEEMARVKSRSLSECSSDHRSIELSGNTEVHFSQAGKQEHAVVLERFIGERKIQGCHVLEARDKVSMDRSIVYQWNIRPKRTGRKGNHMKVGQENQIEELLGKFSALEKEMSSLLRLSHRNLVHYLGMRVINRLNEGISVYVLQKYVQGLPVKYYLDLNIPIHLPLIKHITEGTLEALNYLHQNNVVHRDLRDSCIFLDAHSHQVKVADYGVERRIVEVVVEFIDVEFPPVYPLSPGRGGKKNDVYRLGLIVLSLFLGQRVQQIVPTLPSTLSSELKDFVQRCLEVNEQQRWTAERLLTHSFIHSSTEEKELSPDKEKRNETSPSNTESQAEDEDECSGAGDHLFSEVSLHLPSNLKGHSRLTSEYDVLELLGRGGFGHVFKVRNKVDDRIYALKRICLDQQTEKLRKKINREVKLLSSLNHENVVRYYTSWIDEFTQDVEECPSVKDEETDSTASPGIEISAGSQVHPSSSSESLTKSNEERHEQSGQQDESEWSIIFNTTSNHPGFTTSTDFVEESEDDDDDWLMGSLRPLMKEEDEDSDDIEFYKTQCIEDQTDSVFDNNDAEHMVAPSTKQKKLQFLYIQMQLCENNTLRQAINNSGLHLDYDRMWRLFREIVNGLDYIHSQGLIHRDLKPGNIFIDSADHVKIGDFGLATAAIKAKTTGGLITKGDVEESSALTGQVGTTFYIAPEITKAIGKVSYTSKVDIYSLGVIFFEMVYPPLTTGMERVKVLSDLRKPEIKFPNDFPKMKNTSCTELISWLLHQDPHLRPSTTEILKSSLLPPPTAEEKKFVETLETRLQNIRSSKYQEILNLVFKPSARPELEATFEMNHKASSKYWHYWNFDYLQALFVSIFKAHGGIWVPTSFYIPKGSFYNDKENLVCLMAHKGELVSAQYDLRYPFARFVARNEIKFMRRYCIDRVQRAYKVSGIHPKESYECAFDIVSSKRDLPESSARVMLVAHDIIQQIIQRSSEYVYICVGHLDLVQVILNYCGIEEKLYPEVFSLLKEFNNKRMTVENFIDFLCDIGIAKSSAESLKGFLYMEGPLEDVITSLQNKGLSYRRKNLAAAVKHVLNDLSEIKEASTVIGIKFDIKLRPLMVADAHLYSGFMCQFLMNMPKKMGNNQDLLAQGGSYEYLILQHRRKLLSTEKNAELPAAVGVSLFLEKFDCCIAEVIKLMATGQRDIDQVVAGLGCGSGVISVLVCAIGGKQLEDRINIVRQLRAAKITADHCHCLNQKEAETVLEDLRASNLVMLTSSDKADIRIRSDPTGRTLERKILLEKVPEFILKNMGVADAGPSSNFSRSDSKTTGVNQEDYQLNIQYITKKQAKCKDAAKWRDVPKVDQQINKDVLMALTSRWPSLGPNTTVEVLAVELDKKAVLALGALDTDTTAKSFNETVSDIKALFPEQKDYIEEICKLLHRKIFPRKKIDRGPLIFYSLSSNICKRII
nr:eIF-2-alpha kinase GCN2-like isoform X2 [Cherax quadricarinatus]